MNVTLPPEIASALKLEIVGDQAVVTVDQILPDGGVSVRTDGLDSVPMPAPAAPGMMSNMPTGISRLPSPV